MRFSPKMNWLLLGCSLAAFASPALAQQVTEESEIVVTAQNRSQSVQDVPIAMSVIGAEEIANAGITDFTAVQRVAPDIQITNDTTLTRVTLRGIGTNSNDETQDQSIAINIDGEYINRPTVLNASLFDLERVEVLRGPQGTLYGRNATGGAVNFLARRAGSTFGANGAITYGSYGQLIGEAGLSLPLGDRAGLRIAFMGNSADGFNEHPNAPDSGDQGTLAGRIGLSLDPTENLSIYLAAELVDVDVTLPSQAWVNNNAVGFRADEGSPGACNAAAGWIEVAPLVAGVQCLPQNTNYLATIDRHNYTAPNTGNGRSVVESQAYRAQVGYDFGDVQLTYRGGFRSTENTADVTLSPGYIFRNFFVDIDTQSHELRLNGEFGNGIIWQGGAFLFVEDQAVSRGLFNPSVGPNGSYINFFHRPTVETEAMSYFGQIEFPLTEQLTLVTGARYTDDERSGVFRNYGFQFNSGPVNLINTPAVPTVLNLNVQNDQTTWLAGLNYEPSEDTLLYARVSTGFKAGGFDSVGVYQPETVTAYEVGVKNDLGNAIINGSIFYYDYSDLQVGVLLDAALGNQIFNAGEATIFGAEVQVDWDVTPNDVITFTANYLNAEYGRFLAAYPVQCLGCGLNGVGDLDGVAGNPITQPRLDGNTPPRSPEWVLTAGWDHVFPLNSGAELTFSAITRYNSGYYTTAFNFNDDEQEAFTQSDVSLMYSPADGRWAIQAFVRNLEDYRELTWAAFTSAGPDDVYNWQFGAPRTMGVRLSVDY